MGGVVEVKLTHLKLNALSFSDTLNDSETLVKSIYQLRSNGGSMQGEVLLRGHLKARDFECLLNNHGTGLKWERLTEEEEGRSIVILGLID